jgi:hypothetical protein
MAMPVSLVTSYTKYNTFHCNYFLSQWSSAVCSVLVVGTFIVITLLSVLYFSTYNGGKKSERSVRSINIVLFTLRWVAFFCMWCSQLYTSPFATQKGTFCVPLFLGFWGCIILNCFCCRRK